jgi:hypothetical protein
LSPGGGNVEVISNLVLGNSAGAGDGGGMRLARVNGADVAANPNDTPRRNGNQGQNDPAPWNRVDVFNNMIVDNVAALAGGGISLQDTVGARIVHNTIANNDSLGVAGEAFAPGSPNQSTPQPGAGLVSRSHSAVLAGASASVGGYSVPLVFADNIVWHNRQFSFFVDTASNCVPGDPSCTSTYGLCPDVTGNTLNCPGGNTVVYDDLAVIGAVGALPCTNCIVSDDGDPDPLFVAEYANGAASAVFQPEVTTAIQTPVAFDEGGNFIRPRFGPLALYDDPTSNDGDAGSLFGDYHLQPGSSAIDAGLDFGGTYPALVEDIDNDMRPVNSVDIGADEAQ